MARLRSLLGLSNPSLKQLNLNAVGQTTNPLDPGWYRDIPNQGSPTFTPSGSAISLPAGYYGGGTVGAVQVKVATGTVATPGAQETFTEYGGTTVSLSQITIPVPTGATEILMVIANFSNNITNPVGDKSASLYTVASPLGYMDGSTASVLATVVDLFVSGNPQYSLIAGGSLSISTTSIVVPTGPNAESTYYTVFYV